MDSVREEITWSRRLFARQGWPILDVTNNAIEETAARVVDLLHLPRAAGL
jgi:regulator of PEP synthase PpsR (kinase-PPPase family)